MFPYAYPERGRWSRASKNRLPDSAFLFVEHVPGSYQDGQGRTHPLSLRHLPYRAPSGAIDRTHLANAIARLAQGKTMPHIDAAFKLRLMKMAQAIYDREFGYRKGMRAPRPPLKERAYPRSAVGACTRARARASVNRTVRVTV